MNEHITTEEKIDYIYNELKKENKRKLAANILKWVFRIFIFWYMYYIVAFMIPDMMNSMTESITPDFLSSES